MRQKPWRSAEAIRTRVPSARGVAAGDTPHGALPVPLPDYSRDEEGDGYGGGKGGGRRNDNLEDDVRLLPGSVGHDEVKERWQSMASAVPLFLEHKLPGWAIEGPRCLFFALRELQLESKKAWRIGPQAPEFGGAEHMLGQRWPVDGTLIDPAGLPLTGEEVHQIAEVDKQARLAKAGEWARFTRADGGGANDAGDERLSRAPKRKTVAATRKAAFAGALGAGGK